MKPGNFPRFFPGRIDGESREFFLTEYTGKTSIVKAITGLLRPGNGRVSLNGLDPRKNAREVKSLIGMVPQESAVYEELSAYGNCEFQASLYNVPLRGLRNRIEEILELVDLKERMKEPVRNFSGGMKRRLAIGKALIHDPQILILDEPTLGVDVQGTHKIWNYISDFAETGKTIIITTNVMNEADRLANRICIIDKGRVIVQGTPAELKSQLGSEEIILRFTNEGSMKKAADLIGMKYSVRGSSLVIASSRGTSDLIKIVNALPAECNPEGIELKQPTLDDVFLSHTGRSLRD